jgi:hypothetical protein
MAGEPPGADHHIFAVCSCPCNKGKTVDQITSSLARPSIAALRNCRANARIAWMRRKLENRRSPILPFLERGHFLNRSLGKLRHQVSKRGSQKKTISPSQRKTLCRPFTIGAGVQQQQSPLAEIASRAAARFGRWRCGRQSQIPKIPVDSMGHRNTGSKSGERSLKS